MDSPPPPRRRSGPGASSQLDVKVDRRKAGALNGAIHTPDTDPTELDDRPRRLHTAFDAHDDSRTAPGANRHTVDEHGRHSPGRQTPRSDPLKRTVRPARQHHPDPVAGTGLSTDKDDGHAPALRTRSPPLSRSRTAFSNPAETR